MLADKMGMRIEYKYPRYWYEVTIWESFNNDTYWGQFVTKAEAKKKIIEILKNSPEGSFADLKKMFRVKSEGYNDYDEYWFYRLENGELKEDNPYA